MSGQYIYWQNSDFPFSVIRQTGFSTFECFDHRLKAWKRYENGFREVSLNHECRQISEEEANRITDLLASVDTSGMDYKALCALVR